jgi:hypothetical protein
MMFLSDSTILSDAVPAMLQMLETNISYGTSYLIFLVDWELDPARSNTSHLFPF